MTVQSNELVSEPIPASGKMHSEAQCVCSSAEKLMTQKLPVWEPNNFRFLGGSVARSSLGHISSSRARLGRFLSERFSRSRNSSSLFPILLSEAKRRGQGGTFAANIFSLRVRFRVPRSS